MEIRKSSPNWEKVKIDEVGVLLRGISYKKNESSDKYIKGYKPILRSNNINNSLNFDDLVYVPIEKINPEQYIKKDDIIFAMSSGSKHLVGKSAQAIYDFNGSFGAFCSLLRPLNCINSIYLSYFFKGNNYKKLIAKIAKRTNINNLKREHILELYLPLPPIFEQHQIVSKLEELFSELDKGIENLEKAKAQLKTYRQSVLKQAFEGKLTEDWRRKTPSAKWQKMQLGDLIKVKSGNGLYKSHRVETGNYFVYGGNGIMGKHDKYMF